MHYLTAFIQYRKARIIATAKIIYHYDSFNNVRINTVIIKTVILF